MSLVPKYLESPWYKREGRGATCADPEWPRVGVYCRASSHTDSPWLIGSFVMSAEVLEQRDMVYWSIDDDFMSGDGYLIRLGRGFREASEDSRSTTYLVGDKRYTSKDRQRFIERAGQAVSERDFETARQLQQMHDANEASVRSRISPECGRCGDRLVLRTERAHSVVSRLWSAGVREMTIEDLRRAYRFASGRGC